MSVTIRLESPVVDNASLTEEQRARVERLELAEGVNTVGSAAFARLPHLTSVVIPSTVENWGQGGAFRECPNLREVVACCRKIGPRVFARCAALQDVRLNGTIIVGEFAFAGCSDEVLARVNRAVRNNIETERTRALQIWFADYSGREEFTNFLPGYQQACARFDEIDDWRMQAALENLVLAADNHIANLGNGALLVPDVRAIGKDALGRFLNRLSEELRAGANDECLAAFQQEFFGMIPAGSNGRPILMFTRHIAGLAHGRYVPVPDFNAMNSCYGWMVNKGLIDNPVHGAPGGDVRESFLLWLRQSQDVRDALRKYLSDRSDAETGVFAWLLARKINEDSSSLCANLAVRRNEKTIV